MKNIVEATKLPLHTNTHLYTLTLCLHIGEYQKKKDEDKEDEVISIVSLAFTGSLASRSTARKKILWQLEKNVKEKSRTMNRIIEQGEQLMHAR